MRRPPLFLLFPILALIGAVVFFGFPKRDVAPTPPDPIPFRDNFVSNPGPSALSNEECNEFGKKLEAAVRAGDTRTVQELLCIQEIARRAVQSVPAPREVREKFLEVVHAAGPSNLAQSLAQLVREGGKFAFLQTITRDGKPCAIFRFVAVDARLNYVLVFLARDPNGQVAADDYNHLAYGESFFESTRQLLLKPLPRMQPNDLDRQQAILFALREGRKQDAYRLYRELPPELQKEKKLQVQMVVASQEMGEQEYHLTAERFRRDYPNDPVTDLATFDYLLAKKQFSQAEGAVSRIDELVGGDPYLVSYRGRIRLEEGRHADAKMEFEKALKACPDHDEIIWARILVAAMEKNYDDTRDWLKQYVLKFDVVVTEPAFKRDAPFEPFLASSQYQEFRKWQDARGK